MNDVGPEIVVLKGEPGSYKCKSKKPCYLCDRIVEGNSYISNSLGGKSRDIEVRVDCKSKWCIYLATCKKCDVQYVGSSKQTMQDRHHEHRRQMGLTKTKKLGKMVKREAHGLFGTHFSEDECGTENLQIQIIHQLRPLGQKTETKEDMEKRLRETENVFIHELGTFVPSGLNERNEGQQGSQVKSRVSKAQKRKASDNSKDHYNSPTTEDLLSGEKRRRTER